MTQPFKKTLTDVDANIGTEAFSITSTDLAVGGGSGWSVRKYTLRGGQQEGIEVVEIDNGRLRFAVLPTRGMGIWKGECQGLRLGWDSPVKDPVHPSYIHATDHGGIGWLKGFNEWVVRCGLSSMGAPGLDRKEAADGSVSETMLNVHGNIANIPARKVSIEISDTGIVVRGEVDEAMLFGPALRLNTEIRTGFGSNALTISDTVTNIGQKPTEYEILYHINYGPPLLEKGARFMAPARQVVPRDPRAAEGIKTFEKFEAPAAGYAEQVYFFELIGKRGSRETVALLRNAKGNLGSAIRFSLKTLPWFTLWKNTAAEADGYVTGLEPGTALPNRRMFERKQGRVIELAGGASYSQQVTIEALTNRASVKAVEAEITSLQASVQRKVHPRPALPLTVA